MPDPIARIGRSANPAERGYQLVIENEDILDHVGRNLFGAVSRQSGLALDRAWRALSEIERDVWRIDAIQRLREHVRDYDSKACPCGTDPSGFRPPLEMDRDGHSDSLMA